MVQMWQRRHVVDVDTPLKAYLLRAVRNRALNVPGPNTIQPKFVVSKTLKKEPLAYSQPSSQMSDSKVCQTASRIETTFLFQCCLNCRCFLKNCSTATTSKCRN